MIKKHLFKTVKALTVAAVVAIGTMTGAGMMDKADNKGVVTAYAFDHQSYADSTGYSLRLDGDVWHCYNSDNQIDYSYDGLAQNEYGWWKVSNGEVDFSFDGLAENEYGWWKVSGGAVDFSYTGMAENEYGWWYVTSGAVDFSYSGLALNRYGWWYLSNGAVDFSYSGLVRNEYGWWKVSNGAVDFGYTGLVYDEAVGWWYVCDGGIDFNYNGLARNEYGEWVIKGGTVDFGYNGEYEGRTVEGGCVVGSGDTPVNPSPSEPETPIEKLNGLIYDEEADKWSYYVDGSVDTDNNGLVEYNGGWFKLNNGVVDFSYNGLAENDGYWFKVTGGIVDFSYTGIAYDWYVVNGTVDKSYTGVYSGGDGFNYSIENGYVVGRAVDNTITIVYHFEDGTVVPDGKNYKWNGTVRDIPSHYKKEVNKDENGNVVEPVYLTLDDLWHPEGYCIGSWGSKPDEYYIAKYQLSDGTRIRTSASAFSTDISPYIVGNTVDVYVIKEK